MIKTTKLSLSEPSFSGWWGHLGRLRLDAVAGSAVALLGATTMLGWLLRLPALTALHHGLVPMVFNAGLCFFLAGSALLLPLRRGESAIVARTRIAAVLIGLCGLTLIEIVLDRSLAGIDLAFLHEWYDYGNNRPGRMAPNTAVGFLTTACAILAADRVRSRATALTAIGLTFVVLAIGLTGLIGYLLAPDLLFDWARSARMALHTASGMIVTALGLWLAWSRSPWYADEAYLPQDAKVQVLSGAILVLITVTASLTGFVLQQQSVESALQDRLANTAQTRAAWMSLVVSQSELHAQEIARLLGGSGQARQGIAVGNSATLRNRFAQQADHLLHGWQRIALEDVAGNTLMTVGKKRSAPTQFEARLDAKDHAALIWDEHLVLRLRLPLPAGDASTGTELVLERAIPDVAAALFGTAGMGETGEVLVCVKRNDQMLCLPNRSQALPFKLAAALSTAHPMRLRLHGELRQRPPSGRRPLGLSHLKQVVQST